MMHTHHEQAFAGSSPSPAFINTSISGTKPWHHQLHQQSHSVKEKSQSKLQVSSLSVSVGLINA